MNDKVRMWPPRDPFVTKFDICLKKRERQGSRPPVLGDAQHFLLSRLLEFICATVGTCEVSATLR